MKTRRFFLLILSIGIVWLSGVKTSRAAGPTEINADVNVETVWTKESSPYIVLRNISVNAPLTIEPGVVVKFTNVITNNSVGGLSVKSQLIAVGSPLEKIVFTSTSDKNYGGDTSNYSDKWSNRYPVNGDWNGINVFPEYQSPVSIEYAIILYGSYGIKYSTVNQNCTYDSLSVRHSEIRYSSSAGIYLRYTQPILDGLTLASNKNGIEIYATNSDHSPKIRNSSIIDNTTGVRGDLSAMMDARYNWWGDSSGPYYGHSGSTEAANLNGKGNSIVGTSVLFRPWDQNDPTVPKESVIFVPGIGASINPDLMISGVFADNWKMFDHTYDGMIAALKAMGYVEGKTLFIAYYDWRKSNDESAQNYLKPVIQKALNLNPETTKVNVVTHSMGSLVARSYVQSDTYANDVDNLIMIAPPNKGSSDVYAAWEGGRIPNNWEGKFVMKAYLEYLTDVTLNTSNYYETIHQFIPSLKDLMPVYGYIYPVGDLQNLKDYLLMNEKNNFLSNLNSGIDKLNARTKLSIILGDKQPTVNAIPVVDPDKVGIWQDGKPEPIDPQKNDDGGDGEVLISSADVQSAFRDVLNYGHREIVSKSESIVAQRLSDTLDQTYESPTIDDEMVFWSDASADMVITDPNGKTVSKDGNGIENSNYAQETKKDGFKIVSVPNPKKGKYRIKLSGNSDGKAHIGMEYGDYAGNKKEVSSVIETDISSDKTADYVVVFNPENTQKSAEDIVPKDISAPRIDINSIDQNKKEYSSEDKIVISYSVSDDVSAVGNIPIVALFDDIPVNLGDIIDLSEKNLGTHKITVSATDEEGNISKKEITFEIKDMTPPLITFYSDIDGREFDNNGKVLLDYGVLDNFSLGQDIAIHTYLDGSEIYENPIDLKGMSSGEHSIRIVAADKYGNVSEKTMTFFIKIPLLPAITPNIFPNPNIGSSQNKTSHKSSKKKKKKKHKHKHKKKKNKTSVFGKSPVLAIQKRNWVPVASVRGISANKVVENKATFWANVNQSAKNLKNLIFKPFKYFKKK